MQNNITQSCIHMLCRTLTEMLFIKSANITYDLRFIIPPAANAKDVTHAVDKIRQRWKSIRDSYVKYLNKIDKTPAGLKIRPYKFEKQLQFLKPFLNVHKDGQTMNELEETKFSSTDQLVNVSQFIDDDQSSHSSVSSRKRKRNDTSCSSFVFENSVSQLNQTYRTLQQMDDLDIFCLSLSQTMKKLRPLTVAKLKKEMANLITDAEIRELEEMDQYEFTSDSYYKDELDS